MLAAALAVRLVPTLERDANGLVESLRGRGVAPAGLRGHAALLSPLLAGSLERGLNLLGTSSFFQQIVIGVVIITAVLVDSMLKPSGK